MNTGTSTKTIDLTAHYLGMVLRNPLVVAACPLTGDLTTLRRLEEAGAAAAVLPSLFEEQIKHQDEELYRMYRREAQDVDESENFVPRLMDYNSGPDSYLRLIEHAKRSVRMPIIASANGTRHGRWIRYAKLMAEAGADALELNICFIPTDPEMTGGQVEDQVVELVGAVRELISIPLAVKIGPFFSALPNLARRLAAAGANGLILFNRFLEPEIDLESLRIEPRLTLSDARELRLPLRWIAILRDQVSISLAATSGVHSAADTLKAILAGADVVMMASTLLRHGPDYLDKIHHELVEWLQQHEYESLAALRGSMSLRYSTDPCALERANYLKFLTSFSDRTA